MKTLFGAIVALVTAISMIALLAGCEGPAGAPGPPGVNLEGFAAGIQCSTCHSADADTTYFVAARVYQWQHSKHATGGTSERNGASCAGCHTTQGFDQRMRGETVTDQPSASPIGCFACHSPHARGDFSLRNVSPVTIGSNISGIPDAVFDYGSGNLCVQCHKTRSMSPKMPATPGPNDTLTITSSRWYSHYGVQGQMLSGNGGYQFAGFTYRGNSNHTDNSTIRQEGCPLCHMANGVNAGGGTAGGHTMNIRYEAEGSETALLVSCNASGCHGGGMTLDVLNSVQQGITDSLAALQAMLISKGWLDPATLGVNASSSSPLKITPAAKAGALYNYFFVEHDLSEGIHNTKYAEDLLSSSLQALRTP